MVIEMTIGKVSFAYLVKKLRADFGMGFEFRKFDGGDVYHVHYDPARKWSRCDCKGGEFCGHCKHASAIVALIESGKIAVPTAKPEAPKPEEKELWCSHCNDNRDVYCPHCSL
jgi:hypothetical protein